MHQDLTEEEVANEVDWAIQNGLKGIKLHPDFQKFVPTPAMEILPPEYGHTMVYCIVVLLI